MAARQNNDKTKYSDAELSVFEKIIDDKLSKAKEQLAFYMEQIQELSDNDDSKLKGLDDGISSVETERLYTMAARQKKLIQHLDNAKLRIKNKVYGICRMSGKLIPKERLMAVPHATLSIEAKQQGL